VVVPSDAVTTMLIVFSPATKLIAGDAVPEATAVPFTVMEVPAVGFVGVTVMLVTPAATLEV